MESRLLLDVVVRQSAAILELLSGKDKTLLIGGNTFLILDLGLDVVNGVRGLDIEGDGLTGQGLDKDLHTTTETKDQVESRLLLDVVVRQSAAVLELLTGKDKTLLIGGNAFLILDLGLDVVNGVRGLDIEGDGLTGQGLDKDLHTTTETEDQVESRLLLDVVVRQSAAILQLLTGKDKTLLIGGDAFLILDLGLDVVNGVRGLDIEGDGLTGQGLDKDLHTTTETKDQVESRLLLDVVVRQSAAILELLTGKDKTLLIRGDALLVLDLGLDVVNGVRGLDIEGDGLTGQGLNKDLHTTTETKDQVESRLLLDVVVRESAAILQLLTGKDKTLLIGGDALLILDLGLDVVNGVRGLDIEGDGLAGQGLDKDLHTATETEDQVESRLLLDVVVRQSAAVLQLLTGEDKTLLIGGDALLVLDLGLDVVNGVRGLDIEGDGLAGQSLDKDLHTATETKDEVESRLLLDVVVRQSAAVLQLLTGKDKTLLIGGNALLILDLGLDVVNGVRGLDIEGDGLTG